METIAIILLLSFIGLAALYWYWAITPYDVLLDFAVGGVLVLRAVGKFKSVGFFKRVNGSKFATYDSRLFSPFCLLAGRAFLVLAAGRI
ncbi:DUF3995 domain-containing protein [Oceanobacter sp. 4_MG-2023]|jgi:hypothetical protein|uniref:DUF3995 domain-containing protein n=1 Tax=Oceanobacter sp. 4_MG-2023 TaxID=3062623 RepID=UPI00351F4633